jgi:hypothetical protein
MKKSLNDLKYDFGKAMIFAGAAPIYLSPLLESHPFSSFWTWLVSALSIFFGFLFLRSAID